MKKHAILSVTHFRLAAIKPSAYASAGMLSLAMAGLLLLGGCNKGPAPRPRSAARPYGSVCRPRPRPCCGTRTCYSCGTRTCYSRSCCCGRPASSRACACGCRCSCTTASAQAIYRASGHCHRRYHGANS